MLPSPAPGRHGSYLGISCRQWGRRTTAEDDPKSPPEGQSGLRPANLTTLPHFSISLAMKFPKLAGEPGSTVPPRSANRAFTLASDSAALISLLSLSII